MFPGLGEATAGLKAVTTILQALQQGTNAKQWPDLHESLLSLHAILTEWCDRAALLADALIMKRDYQGERLPGGAEEEVNLLKLVAMVEASNAVTPNIGRLWSDFSGEMRPAAQLRSRWSRRERRAAARRGLATIMQVYCPDLLASIDLAVDERRTFVDRFSFNGDPQWALTLTESEFNELHAECQRTVDQLLDTTHRLAEFIVEKFPIDPA